MKFALHRLHRSGAHRGPVARLSIAVVLVAGGLVAATPGTASATPTARIGSATSPDWRDAPVSSPLPTPANLQALHVADTTADLSWLGSGLGAGDVVEHDIDGAWQQYASGLFGSLALTDLTPATHVATTRPEFCNGHRQKWVSGAAAPQTFWDLNVRVPMFTQRAASASVIRIPARTVPFA